MVSTERSDSGTSRVAVVVTAFVSIFAAVVVGAEVVAAAAAAVAAFRALVVARDGMVDGWSRSEEATAPAPTIHTVRLAAGFRWLRS